MVSTIPQPLRVSLLVLALVVFVLVGTERPATS
jgi:hypothetical protein